MNEIEAYNKFVQILNSLQPYSIDLSLNRIKLLLKKIGNPENSFKSVIVGGTNGKGSVCQFLSDSFIDSGFLVGTYTSPHLIQINERFKINNRAINYKALFEYAEFIRSKSNGINLTYFEFLTVLAFFAFSDIGVDIAILEVGMGGEFDATNVVNPILSIITRISLDHTEHLGKTHKQIAKTKAKIIKNTAVIGKNNKTVTDTIRAETDAELFFADNQYLEKAKRIDTLMSGAAVKENLSTALLAIDVLNKKYSLHLSYEPFEKSFWPGRFEIINTGSKTIILDGAHNKNAVIKLILSLKSIKDDKILIFSSLKQKSWENNLKILMPNFNKIILTPISQHKLSLKMEDAKKIIGGKKTVEICKNINDAIFKSLKEKEKIIVVTGSLYLVGEAKACSITKNFLP